MNKFFSEDSMANKEAVIGALSSFLRATNYAGKKEFIDNHGGLQFLLAILQEEGSSTRLLRKVCFLINDIVSTADKLYPETP